MQDSRLKDAILAFIPGPLCLDANALARSLVKIGIAAFALPMVEATRYIGCRSDMTSVEAADALKSWLAECEFTWSGEWQIGVLCAVGVVSVEIKPASCEIYHNGRSVPAYGILAYGRTWLPDGQVDSWTAETTWSKA